MKEVGIPRIIKDLYDNEQEWTALLKLRRKMEYKPNKAVNNMIQDCIKRRHKLFNELKEFNL